MVSLFMFNTDERRQRRKPDEMQQQTAAHANTLLPTACVFFFVTLYELILVIRPMVRGTLFNFQRRCRRSCGYRAVAGDSQGKDRTPDARAGSSIVREGACCSPGLPG